MITNKIAGFAAQFASKISQIAKTVSAAVAQKAPKKDTIKKADENTQVANKIKSTNMINEYANLDVDESAKSKKTETAANDTSTNSDPASGTKFSKLSQLREVINKHIETPQEINEEYAKVMQEFREINDFAEESYSSNLLYKMVDDNGSATNEQMISKLQETYPNLSSEESTSRVEKFVKSDINDRIRVMYSLIPRDSKETMVSKLKERFPDASIDEITESVDNYFKKMNKSNEQEEIESIDTSYIKAKAPKYFDD